jgi:hypothetical protein
VVATAAVFCAGFLAGGVVETGPCRRRALAFDVRRFERDPFAFFDALGVRADVFPSTSAETSNVQRTRRPFLSGGILMCFDTMICPRFNGDRAIRMPRSFRADGGIAEGDGYRTVGRLANPSSRLSHFW